MKKLIWMFLAVTVISFVSCGNKTVSNDASIDTDSVAVDSIGDSLIVDSL